jgi:ABC-2 type transport system permease protein
MQRRLRILWSLTVASTKMYFRNRTGVFFTLFIPIILVVVFGLLSKGDGGGSISLNINDQAHTQLSQQLVKSVQGIKVFKVTTDSQSAARDRLGKGKLDLEVIVPPGFGTPGAKGLEPSQIVAEYNQAKPGNGQTAGLILGQLVAGYNNQATHADTLLSVKTEGVKTNNLGYIDFILPGIIALSIMQLGIFSVAFGFVSYKTTGALRRIQATPTHAINFITAQGITRLLVAFIQVLLLVGLGVWLFSFHMIGSIWAFLFIALLGSVLFLGFGFAIAGWAKDENQAAPVAQLIQFPMLFLSGIFFPRDSFPDWLRTVTDYFPLTYLADAMRRIANEGAHLSQLAPEILGMTVWTIAVYFVAVKVFRWE